MDFATATQIESILGGPIGLQAGWRVEPGQRLNLTVGEVLQRHVVVRLFPKDQTMRALVNLLSARGYMNRVANPQVIGLDGKESRMEVTDDEHFWIDPKSGQLQETWTGTSVKLRPHVLSDQSAITMEMEAQITSLPHPRSGNEVPIVTRRTTANAFTMADGGSFVIAMTGDPNNPWRTKDGKSLYILTTAHIVPERDTSQGPGSYRQLLRASETAIRQDVSTTAGTIGALPAVSTPRTGGPSPQQALLEVRTVVSQTGESQKGAVSNPRILVQAGRETQIVAFGPKGFSLNSPGTEESAPASLRQQSGIVLSIIPQKVDSETVTFDITAEIAFLVKPPQGSDSPVLHRRTATGSCMVRYSGTVAAIGLMDNAAGREDELPREIAVFVTAHLMPDNNPPESLNLPPGMGAIELEPGDAGVPPELLAIARRQAVNDDPRIRALNEEIATLEVDLVRARQTMMDNHPQFLQIRSQIEALKQRSDEIRKELEREYGILSAVQNETQVGAQPNDALEPSAAGASAEIQVECRFVLVDEEWMEAFTKGSPIPGVTSPEDVNALHEIGKGLSAEKPPLLNPDQVELLMKGVRGHQGNKMLATARGRR